MPASTPVMVAGYTNLAETDLHTSSAAEGDGSSGYVYDGAVVWHLTRVLLLCGATCTGSSTRTSGTGTAANSMSAGDLWSSGVAAASYQGAWWALSLTINGIQRNFVLQVGGTGVTGVRIKMSIGAGNEFTNSGGSVTATRTKAVTGQHVLTPEPGSAGTDASPTYAPLPAAGVAQYLSACWDSATGYLAFEMHPAAGGTKSSAGFVFAILPLDANTVLSTRDTHVVLCSPATLLDTANLTETSSPARAIYQCRKGLSGTALAAAKPQWRIAVGTTAADPGGDKVNGLVSFKRDGAPVDTGGLAPDCIALGQVISVPTMHDVRINPNSATVRRYLCLGELALRFPNSFVSA